MLTIFLLHFVFFFLSGAVLKPSALLLIVYLVELYFLVLGLSLLLCSLFPKFRDISHIWEVFVQLGFWGTPIIYPISIVPEKYHVWIFMNPVARIIQGSREAIIGGPTNFSWVSNHAIIIAAASILMFVGWTSFSRMSRSFAEDL